VIGRTAYLDGFESMIFSQCPSCSPKVLVEDHRRDSSSGLSSKRLRARDCWRMCATWVIPLGFDLKEHCLPSAEALG
jgi:hypothetical protein